MTAASGPASGFEWIRYEKRAGVAHIILNQPEQLNVLGFGPHSNRDEIVRALDDADADDAIGSVLISSTGRAFCAGGDLTKLKRRETVLEDHEFGVAVADFYANLLNTRKPVLAAVNGLCLGAGLGLIAHCDLVVAADDARFGLVEGRLGLPGAADIVHLIGAAWAKFLIWTGEMIDSSRAERIGLILAVVPGSELLERATDLAERIARMPREGILLNKLGINRVSEALGRDTGRLVGQAHETLTRSMAKHAKAPDGQLFEEILRAEGVSGVKAAREQQFTRPWLKP